jgi:hypothetical protein
MGCFAVEDDKFVDGGSFVDYFVCKSVDIDLHMQNLYILFVVDI